MYEAKAVILTKPFCQSKRKYYHTQIALHGNPRKVRNM